MRIANREECIGCSMCANICKKHAINMIMDELHFVYPIIDNNKCIECDECYTVCPVVNPRINNYKVDLQAYSGHYYDEEKILESASGGFVSSLSEAILMGGGIVYGVEYNSDFSKAVYSRADNIKDLSKFKGSKYIMSEANNSIYELVKKDLEEDRMVLFIGCPCEVYSIKHYLKSEYKNLLTCDLICQGGTSPKALQLFVEELRKNYNCKAKYINMRGKIPGKIDAMMMVEMESGQLYCEKLSETDFDVFFRNVKRKCCYNCRFKFPNNAGDFIAGDYIGINKEDDGYSANGTSLIITCNKKAESWVEKLQNFCLYKVNFEKATGIQTCLFNSIEKTIFNEILSECLKKGEIVGIKKKIEVETKNILFDIVAKQKSKIKNGRVFLIWGLGKYFDKTWSVIKEIFPNCNILAIVDKYRKGERYGVRIIKPERVFEIEFDYVFISSVGAQEEAVSILAKKFGENHVNDRYAKVMLPSDIK